VLSSNLLNETTARQNATIVAFTRTCFNGRRLPVKAPALEASANKSTCLQNLVGAMVVSIRYAFKKVCVRQATCVCVQRQLNRTISEAGH